MDRAIRLRVGYGVDEDGQHIRDGDGLTYGPHPLGGHHRRKDLGEISEHLERDTP